MAHIFSKWTEQEIATLRKLAGKNSGKEISKEIGRGYDGIQKMIRKLGLPRYEFTGQQRTLTVVNKSPKDTHQSPVKSSSSTLLRKPQKPYNLDRITVKGSVEWCPSCHSPVSNWSEHRERMGCKRPA